MQGSAADIAKAAMIRSSEALGQLEERLGRPMGRLLLQIHDELLFEVPVEHLADAAAAIRGAMEGAVDLEGVPLPVKMQAGRSWGELQPLI